MTGQVRRARAGIESHRAPRLVRDGLSPVARVQPSASSCRSRGPASVVARGAPTVGCMPSRTLLATHTVAVAYDTAAASAPLHRWSSDGALCGATLVDPVTFTTSEASAAELCCVRCDRVVRSRTVD